jgi:hypothetical protein
METEIQLLKKEATSMGIAFSQNIGIELLTNRINMAKAQAQVEVEKGPKAIVALTKAQLRSAKIKEATKLRRVIVTCMDMAKLEGNREGEYVMASNSIVPMIRKMVPYGQITHLEQILINVLEERKFQQRFGKGGQETRQVKEFRIEYLPDLTVKEMEDLKKLQALRKEANVT